MRGRYAPSPTGPLHLGNIRTALVCWLLARLQGGEVFLRFDDLDTPRNKPGSVAQIQADLNWLGLDFHPEVYFQSHHLSDYQTALDQLFEKNLVYPCRCSRKEILLLASAPDNRFPPGRYPGTCRPTDKRFLVGESEQLAWRFKLDNRPQQFNDCIEGAQSENPWESGGDFVVQRKDGFFAYQLATVVDDNNLEITDVVRGVDLIDSTARQLALYQSLQISPPTFWHLPLMLNSQGEKLAKRDGANGLQFYRERGANAEDIVGLLAASLNLVEDRSILSARELLDTITFENLKTALQGFSANNSEHCE
ncbi:MAG: tRNA glutamyl-Q(34) synthetase GluQRS [Acidiferrobacterales bacterium]|nr:tRNA glutamyl-Q(34) synthetase GluQRS [Acidiferrobacterales bacterium]